MLVVLLLFGCADVEQLAGGLVVVWIEVVVCTEAVLLVFINGFLLQCTCNGVPGGGYIDTPKGKHRKSFYLMVVRGTNGSFICRKSACVRLGVHLPSVQRQLTVIPSLLGIELACELIELQAGSRIGLQIN